MESCFQIEHQTDRIDGWKDGRTYNAKIISPLPLSFDNKANYTSQGTTKGTTWYDQSTLGALCIVMR